MDQHSESANASSHHDSQDATVKHMSQQKLTEAAYTLTKFAESATPDEMHQIHDELERAKKKLSGEQYGELLKEMHDINANDQKLNSHLPNLSFYDSTNCGLPDNVKQEWPGEAAKGAQGVQGSKPADVPAPAAPPVPTAPRPK